MRNAKLGEAFPESLRFMNEAHLVLRAEKSSIKTKADAMNLDLLMKEVTWLCVKKVDFTANRQIFAVAEAVKDGSDASWNDNLQHLIVPTAKMYVHQYVMSLYMAALANFKRAGISAELQDILEQCGRVWLLQSANKFLESFLEEGYMDGTQSKLIKWAFVATCQKLRANAVPLVDAWGLPDFVLKAPIGKWDGRIYPGNY